MKQKPSNEPESQSSLSRGLKALMAEIKILMAKRSFKNSVFLVLNTGFMTLSGFIFWAVVARTNTPADVGISASILSSILLIGMLSMVGLNYTMVRFLPGSKDPVELINSFVMLITCICFILTCLFLTGLQIWSPGLAFLQQNIIAMVSFGLFSLLWTLTNISEYIFIAGQMSKYVMYKNLIYAVLRISLPFVAAMLTMGVYGIVGSWGLAVLIALIVTVVFFLPKAQSNYRPSLIINTDLIKALSPYAFGSYLISLFGAGPRLILPILVLNVTGAEDNAYFFIAWSLAELVFSIPVATSLSLFSLGSNSSDTLYKDIDDSLKMTFLFILPAVLVFILAGHLILAIFGQSYSMHSLQLLQLLALSSLPSGINYIYSAVLRIKKKLGELTLIRGSIAVITLVSAYYIVPVYGIVAIGFVWAGIQTIFAVYSVIRLQGFKKGQHVQK